MKVLTFVKRYSRGFNSIVIRNNIDYYSISERWQSKCYYGVNIDEVHSLIDYIVQNGLNQPFFVRGYDILDNLDYELCEYYNLAIAARERELNRPNYNPRVLDNDI